LFYCVVPVAGMNKLLKATLFAQVGPSATQYYPRRFF
jgi:hypothetical protein